MSRKIEKTKEKLEYQEKNKNVQTKKRNKYQENVKKRIQISGKTFEKKIELQRKMKILGKN